MIAEIYTTVGRHNGISSIFLSQKLFIDNKYYRQISQNADYLVIFKNLQNGNEVRTLAAQIHPSKSFILDIFKHATVPPFSYLFINVTQECIDNVKYLSSLFKENQYVSAYVE